MAGKKPDVTDSKTQTIPSADKEIFSRRDMLCIGVAAATGASGFNATPTSAYALRRIAADGTAADEVFWRDIGSEYDLPPEPINLISGANNPSPRRVLESLITHQRNFNPSPLSSRRAAVTEQLEDLRARLAALAGADADEIALTRGTTEGMNNMIFGLDLEPGDEILTTKHDYPSMKDALYRRAERDGVVVRELDWTPPIEDHAAFAAMFAENMTPRTKAILICHVYDGYAQVSPVRLVSDIAHANGAVVMVDGALAFGNIPIDLHEMGCDYYASSLHKWLGAPQGSGMFYVRRDRIAGLSPLFGVPDHYSEDIRKFEDVGSTSASPKLATIEAVGLYEHIGVERKAARFQYLKEYWSEQLAERADVTFYVRREPEFSGSSLSFSLAGVPPRELWLYLLRERGVNIGIHPYREREGFIQCNYIAPNVFTMPDELDLAVNELVQVANQGLPG